MEESTCEERWMDGGLQREGRRRGCGGERKRELIVSSGLPPAGETERRMGVRLEGGPESSCPHNEGLILGKEMPPRRQAHPGAVTAYQPPFYTPSLSKRNHAALTLLQL
ncbi:hypothetical protein CesoFtcFv8_013097 [Champsocephalus esox]|uniref:Uncharacterized protein n=1 Tax=Champsocephalus esox TaxID=159716 RepID=A0AAN8BVP8_9TELE|nr:hypothetical protein CesoFtcFv8_013097 [Champsocephalus esox]